VQTCALPISDRRQVKISPCGRHFRGGSRTRRRHDLPAPWQRYPGLAHPGPRRRRRRRTPRPRFRTAGGLVTVACRMPQTTPAVPRVPQGEPGAGAAPSDDPEPGSPLLLRPPTLADGPHRGRLAGDSGSVDLYTSHAHLLFARAFTRACRVAVVEGEVVGFVLGYRRPEAPDTLFVWEGAVDPAERGRGVAGRLLADVTVGSRWLEATITADNTASQRLFARFAREHGAEVVRSEL